MNYGKKILGGVFCLLTILMVFTSCAEPEPDPYGPGNLTVEAVEDRGALKLSWDESMKCDIFRAETEAELETVEKLEIEPTRQAYGAYSDKDVVPGTTYYYKARKMGKENWPFSEVVSIECPQFTPKIREFNVEQDGSKAVITWETAFWDGGDSPKLSLIKEKQGDTGYISYTSYISDKGGDGEHTYTTPAGALQPDSTYTFTFKIFPGDSFDEYDSAEDEISIAHNYSLAPTDVEVSKTGADTISVDWTNAADADYYHVYIDGLEVEFANGQPQAGPREIVLPEVPNSGDELLIWVDGAMTDTDYTGREETTFIWP